jgi:Caspase domain
MTVCISRLASMFIMTAAILAFGLWAGQASATDCSRRPDEVTNPLPEPPDMTYPDTIGRDFEFYGKSYALIIGESSYSNMTVLEQIPSEMRKLRSVLESQGFYVSLHLDVKSDDFSNVVECFIASVGSDPTARVVVYYAGHGITRSPGDNPIGYILPIDAPKSVTDPEFLLKAVRISKFLDWAEALEVKHALFIFDACFSGTIILARGEQIGALPPSGYVFSDNVNKPLREFLASGTAAQTVPAQSVFLQFLLQALLGERTEADSNRDGYLTGTELASFLEGIVPTRSKQTPVHGRLQKGEFDIGDIVFKLPASSTVVTEPQKESETTFQPVFTGTNGNGGQIVGQLYEAEKFLNTSATNCGEQCSAEKNGKSYTLKIEIPSNLPANAVFSAPELTCKNCTKDFAITSQPSLSADLRSVTVTVTTWEKAAIWVLRAKVLVPASKEGILVVNFADNKVAAVDPNKLSVIRDSLPIKAEELGDFNATVVNLQSRDTATRRGARAKLAELVATDDGTKVAQLVRGLNTGTYRYQLGIAEALRKTPDGWKTTESTSRDTLATLMEKTTDRTLKLSLKEAIDNIQASVYYEISPDDWLTKAGQLRPIANVKPPLPVYEALKTGDKLVADSSVYLRAGPSIEFGTLGVLEGGRCVKVVGKEENEKLMPTQRGGWLRVIEAPCD